MRFSAAAKYSSLKERTLEPSGADMRSQCLLDLLSKCEGYGLLTSVLGLESTIDLINWYRLRSVCGYAFDVFW